MSALGPIPEPEVIIKKIRTKGHGGHHGGAWKVAYADFVTAMMAFFLLMWLLGAVNEKDRKGIADYFSPTLEQSKPNGGAGGVLGGRSIEEPDGLAPHPTRSAIELKVTRRQPDMDKSRMQKVEQEIRKRINSDPGLKGLQRQIKFTETPEGLRIELIDDADYSMFTTGTIDMDPRARTLLSVVAQAIDDVPNKLAIRGHTDSNPFRRSGHANNNWALSASRAEATREALVTAGVQPSRIARLEGVADTEPHVPEDGYDPRNRRMSITLLRR